MDVGREVRLSNLHPQEFTWYLLIHRRVGGGCGMLQSINNVPKKGQLLALLIPADLYQSYDTVELRIVKSKYYIEQLKALTRS